MDQWWQIHWTIIDDAFYTLNWLCDLVWKELVEEYITLELDPTSAEILGKERMYTWLYGSSTWWINSLIQYWKNWELVRLLKNSNRILEKLRKWFRYDNVDFELHIMANIIRAWWTVEILKESVEKTPDFRFRFDTKSEWIYSEITRRWKSTWDYAKSRAEELVNVMKENTIWKEATLCIKRVISKEEFERLIIWLKWKPCDMNELGDFALFYTNNHWVDKMSLSFEYIGVPFFWTWWHSFENNNFIRIHAHYEDGIVSKISDGNWWQLVSGEKNILFIDSTHTTYIESRKIVDDELEKEINSNISVIILARMGLGITTEVLIIKNPKAKNPILDDELDKISHIYKRL